MKIEKVSRPVVMLVERVGHPVSVDDERESSENC